MITLCAGSFGLTQMAGSSAASPPLGTGSVSTVAMTVSSAAADNAAGVTASARDPAPSASDFEFSFFFSDLSFDLSLDAPGLPVCASTVAPIRAKAKNATIGVNTSLLIDFNPRIEFIKYCHSS